MSHFKAKMHHIRIVVAVNKRKVVVSHISHTTDKLTRFFVRLCLRWSMTLSWKIKASALLLLLDITNAKKATNEQISNTSCHNMYKIWPEIF